MWTLWDAHTKTMIYPPTRLGPPPNPDMPASAKNLYEEARTVAQPSARAAAGLSRVALESMLRELYPDEQDLNACIAAAVKDGLRRQVQQAMDILRVTGNDALHLAEIRLEDDPETVVALLRLVNLVAEQIISEPQALDDMYASLPEGKRQAIARCDSPSPEAE